MQITTTAYALTKQFALTISRGTHRSNENLWIRIGYQGIEGWGEAAEFSTGHISQSPAQQEEHLQSLLPILEPFTPWDHQQINQILREQHTPSALRAAIDMALYDWRGKKLGVPVWQMWGLQPQPQTPLSVTVGLNTPELAQQRLEAWLQKVQTNWIKVKLGSPQGIRVDQTLFATLQDQSPSHLRFLVDANGGWSLADAMEMSEWLANRQVVYLEQPLAAGREADLKTLKKWSPLPLFADESCWSRSDICSLAESIDGINIKLMKCGGLTEALAMIATARAFGLQVMLGCYSESSLANTAAAQLSSLVDYLDLDSHLNLSNDPFEGATPQNGTLSLPDRSGLGVIHRLGH
ncbi:MAG: dipeptide epimerase [Prochlorotrichaceae cyanobacterium]